MDSLSTISNSSTPLRSFWARPEGKVGMVVLIALTVGAGLMVWSVLLPLLLGIVWGTIQLVVGGVILATLLFLLFSSTVHRLVGLSFKLIMRFLTGLVITIDPIGILKERLTELRKRQEKLGEQITNISATVNNLKAIIAKNKADAASKQGIAREAMLRVNSTTDADEKTRMTLQVNINSRAATRLLESNKNYDALLTKTQSMYTFLSRLKVNVDFFIADTSDEVKQQEIQYKTVNSASKAYRTAMSIVKGNVDEDELYNNTMEFLAQDAARKLGEIDEFQKAAQNFMDTMDLSNASANAEALKVLEIHEQKLLSSGSLDAPKSSSLSAAQPVSVTSTNDDYSKLLDS